MEDDADTTHATTSPAKTDSPKKKNKTKQSPKLKSTHPGQLKKQKTKTPKKQKKTSSPAPPVISPFHLSASSSYATPLTHPTIHISHVAGSPSLVQHAIAGDLVMVKKVLENKAENVNQTQLGCSALHYAAFHNRLSIVEFLIYCQADVNLPNLSGETPLHWAVKNGHTKVVSCLMEWGSKVMAADHDGNTPLHLAASSGHVEMLRLLLTPQEDSPLPSLNCQTKAGETPLFLAAEKGHLPIVQLILSFQERTEVEGMKVAELVDVDEADHKDTTPLHVAVRKHEKNVVMELLRHGANPNALDHKQKTALHLATFHADLDVINALIEHKCDASSVDKYGKTALDLALQRSRLHSVQFDPIVARLLLVSPAPSSSSSSSDLTLSSSY